MGNNEFMRPLFYKRLVISVILLISTLSCFAGQISIQIVQHDKINDSVTEQSMVLEDEIMTGFFDKGFIVTNSPAAVSTTQETDDNLVKSGMVDAYDGSCDYFLQVRLFYKEAKSDLEKVSCSIYSMNTGKKIQDYTINKFSLTKKNTTDLQKVSSEIVLKANQAIKA